MKPVLNCQKSKSVFIPVVLMWFLGVMNVLAQDWDHKYVPFVEEGKVWNCYTFANNDYNNKPGDCIFTICGDTVICERAYKKVFCEYEQYYGDKNAHYYCAVREESYQVFFVESETQEEKLICDFNSPKNILYFSRPDRQYARIGGKRISGSPTEQLEFTLCAVKEEKVSYSYVYGTWVEGVGSLANPFSCELYVDEVKLVPRIHVGTCWKGETCVFNQDWLAVPADKVNTLKRNDSPNERLFDLQGRRLNAEPKHGVYIKNGKKVVK